MIIYVLYEGELHFDNNVVKLEAPDLAKKLGLKKKEYKTIGFNSSIPELLNTKDIAYIHIYPQIEDKNYVNLKKYLINV